MFVAMFLLKIPSRRREETLACLRRRIINRNAHKTRGLSRGSRDTRRDTRQRRRGRRRRPSRRLASWRASREALVASACVACVTCITCVAWRGTRGRKDKGEGVGEGNGGWEGGSRSRGDGMVGMFGHRRRIRGRRMAMGDDSGRGFGVVLSALL